MKTEILHRLFRVIVFRRNGICKVTAALLLLMVAFFYMPESICHAQTKNNPIQEEAILTATENLFQSMKARDYIAVWKCISFKTRESIVNDIRKAIKKKSGPEIQKDELRKDLSSGGAIAKEYWDSYLHVFDPDIVLQQCKWDIGKIEKDYAEVILQYKKSDKPAVLKIYREENAWRVGLEESFGARRLNIF